MTKMLIIAMLSTLVLADDFGYHIKDYIPPEFTRRKLELQPDISFLQDYHEHSNKEDDDPASHILHNIEELKVHDGLVYKKVINCRTVQQTDSLVPGAFLECRLRREVNAGLYDHQSWVFNMGVEPEFSRSRRFYLSDLIFYELNWSARVGVEEDWSGSKPDRSTDWTGLWDIMTFINPGIGVMLGMGRIDEVQDARLALFILDAVKTAGALTKEPDNGDIVALAGLLTALNSERRFDTRLHDIKAVSEIESFLLEKNLIAASSAECVMYIADMWQYGNGPVRECGWRAGIGPSISGVAHWINTDFYSTGGTASGRLYLTVERPLSNILQTGYTASTSFSLTYSGWDYEGRAPVDEAVDLQWSTRGEGRIGLYLNTRTRFTASVSMEHRFFSMTRDISYYESDKSTGEHMVIGSIGLSGDYYFSPRASLYGSYNIRISNDQETVEYTDTMSEAYGYQIRESAHFIGSQLFSAGVRYTFF